MRPEQILQQQVAQYLAVALGPRTFYTAILGNARNATHGGIMKSMGLIAGVPDLIVWWHTSGSYPRCVGIELKSGSGRISIAQRETHKRMADAGVPVAIARSMDDVRVILLAAGCPLREHDFSGGDAPRP